MTKQEKDTIFTAIIEKEAIEEDFNEIYPDEGTTGRKIKS